ncbi:MAG: hypothetical protein ACM3YM_08875 [Sphingomonadales bacterium]
MRYTVSGRAQSVITALLAVLLAIAVQVGAADRAGHPHRDRQTAAAPEGRPVAGGADRRRAA